MKFRKGNDEKDLTYTTGVTHLSNKQQATSNKQQADYTVLQNSGPKDIVTESLECRLHSLINQTQNNSESSTESVDMRALKMIQQTKSEHTEQTLMDTTNILESISKRYCNGIMGVPITFTDRVNPQQFKVLGMLQSSTDEQVGILNLRFYNDFKEMRQDGTFTGASGGKANGNPVVKGKSSKGNFLYCEKSGEYVHSVYARIVVQKIL